MKDKKIPVRIPEKELYAFLEGKTKNRQNLFFLVRQFIFKNNPAAEETLKWGMPAYTYKNVNTNYIMANKSHITFGFYFGNHLNDSKKMLEGIGKNLRHIKIYGAEDLKNKDLIQLIKEALKHAKEISKT